MKSAEPGEAGREPERNVEKEPVIRILVAAHKRTYAPENRLIRLVQAGTALAGERLPGMLHDDEGDHISRRNRTYCELTVQYFAWNIRLRRVCAAAGRVCAVAGRTYAAERQTCAVEKRIYAAAGRACASGQT